jgi:hypothetical protein
MGGIFSLDAQGFFADGILGGLQERISVNAGGIKGKKGFEFDPEG